MKKKDIKLKSNNKKGYIPNYELTTNIGFKNIGNTCYMNSFLQIILHIPNFLPELKKIMNIEKDSLIFNLIKLSEYPSNDKYLYEIKKIMGKIDIKYGEFIQSDTQSFAIDFINAMINQIKNETSFSSISSQSEDYDNVKIEDIKKKKFNIFKSDLEKRGEKTFIEDLFLFIDFSTRYKDNLINVKTMSFNLLSNLELFFPKNNENKSFTLYELLDIKYSSSNINDKSNKISKIEEVKIKQKVEKNESFFTKYLSGFINTLLSPCLKNKIKEENTHEEQASKTIVNEYKIIKNEIQMSEISEIKVISKIVSLPKILIISFVRGIEGKKLISSFVSFYDKLDLNKYIDFDLYDTNLGTTYKLYAINLRYGNTKSSGHCYSYVKVNDIWFCYNDTSVLQENPKYDLDSVVGLYYIKD